MPCIEAAVPMFHISPYLEFTSSHTDMVKKEDFKPGCVCVRVWEEVVRCEGTVCEML